MTSLVFKSLLTLSLGANATLALALWAPKLKSTAPIPPGAAAVVSRIAAPATGSASPPGPPPMASAADRALILEAAARFGRTPALGDPRALAEKMLREGYPDDVVSNVVAQLLDEWLGQKAMDQAAREGSATARRLQAIGRGGGPLQKYMQDLFPFWREEAELTKARERELRFGNLPPEKILAVERLEQEFEFEPNRRSSRHLVDSKTRAGVEAKLHESLASVLAPGELKDYWRFNSLVAERLQQQVSSVEIDEATYDRLLAVATDRHSSSGQFSALGDYRGILSDDQFVQLVPREGDTRAEADALYRAAGLSNAQRAELFVLVDGFIQGRDPSRQHPSPQAMLEQIRAALAASPENAARFEASKLAAGLKRVAERK